MLEEGRIKRVKYWGIVSLVFVLGMELLLDIMIVVNKSGDYDDIPTTFKVINSTVNSLLEQEYVDCNLLFNITPGTANFSVALVLNSIKGNRICAYKEQNGIIQTDGYTKKSFRKENINIYELKDVLSEIWD